MNAVALDRHTFKRFDQELAELEGNILEMGRSVARQLGRINASLLTLDRAKAGEILEEDAHINELEEAVDAATVQILVRRNPMADDLRIVVCCMRSAHHLERMGDYVGNIAEHFTTVADAAPHGQLDLLAAMGQTAEAMLADLLDAFHHGDAEKALAVWRADAELDALHNEAFASLVRHMAVRPQEAPVCAHLLQVARGFERLGDHITDVAEQVYYRETSDLPQGPRPQADNTRAMLPELA